MTRRTTRLAAGAAPRGGAEGISNNAAALSCAALVSRIAAGDHGAMRVFYTRHYDKVFRLALRIVRCRHTAEDVAGDVFLEVWRNAGRFERQSEVWTWLFAIVRNKSIDVLRRSLTDPLDEDAMLLIEDEADDPELVLRKRDRDSAVRKCMTRLSRGHRAAVELVYFEDQTSAETARITGIALGTIKTRVFYAREQLAQLLRAEGIVAAAA
jgi:RNA polymerase sigma-70 factor (ECF subfamily)